MSETTTISSLLLEREAATYLRLTPRTLAKYRSEGGGPNFAKLGGRVVYPKEDIDAWIRQCTVSSTAEYRAQSGGSTA
jgi:predicted DNA-binding transcriptional regulator AlpA